jgi:hypothetical protein
VRVFTYHITPAADGIQFTAPVDCLLKGAMNTASKCLVSYDASANATSFLTPAAQSVDQGNIIYWGGGSSQGWNIFPTPILLRAGESIFISVATAQSVCLWLDDIS